MKKIRPLPFLLVLAAILLVMSLPRAFAEKSRGTAAAVLAPVWELVARMKDGTARLFDNEAAANAAVMRLQAENQALTREVKQLQEILQHEVYLTRSGVRRSAAWQKLLDAYAEALPAQVIYRSPSTWDSSCWLNIGEHENQRLGRQVVAKNSPVVVGYSLVGVIDYVGTRQSRVRLLTDSGVTPSVRSVRGEPKQRMLAEQLNLMMDALMEQEGLFADADQKMRLIDQLEAVEGLLSKDNSSLYLAKGVLTGGSRPAWRSQGILLKGSGFNCDFADSVSPARDLRTGAVAGDPKQAAQPILREGDLLVTTGMDGVFPPGLHVAQVVKVHPLKEGDYTYDLDARPVAGNLDDLSLVYILPPVGYDPNEQPPLMGWE